MFSTAGCLSVGDVFETLWQQKTKSRLVNDFELAEVQDSERAEFVSFLSEYKFADIIGGNGQRFQVRRNFLIKILPSGQGNRYFSFLTGLIEPTTVGEFYRKESNTGLLNHRWVKWLLGDRTDLFLMPVLGVSGACILFCTAFFGISVLMWWA